MEHISGKEWWKSRLTLSIVTLLLVMGIGVRLYIYLKDRPMVFDEQYNAAAAQTLSYNEYKIRERPTYMPGFWLAWRSYQKLFPGYDRLRVSAVGMIPSLVAFILGSVLFLRFFSVGPAITGIIVLAFSTPYLNWTTIAKQYSTDILFVLVMLWLAFSFEKKRLGLKGILLFGFAGVAAMWTSAPSVFMIAAIPLAFLLTSKRQEFVQSLNSWLIVGAIWAISAYILYTDFISVKAGDPLNQRFWRAYFMPLSIELKTVRWVVERTLGLTSHAGAPVAPIFDAVVFLGVLSLFANNVRRGLVLILPIGFLLLGSAARIYPYGGRPLTFLAPVFCVLAVCGAAFLSQYFRKTLYLYAVVLLVFGLDLGVYYSRHFFMRIPRELPFYLNYLRTQWKEGDQILIGHRARSQIEYFPHIRRQETREFAKNIQPKLKVFIAASRSVPTLVTSLNQSLTRGRTWVIFSNRAHRNRKSFLRHQVNGKIERVYDKRRNVIFLVTPNTTAPSDSKKLS